MRHPSLLISIVLIAACGQDEPAVQQDMGASPGDFGSSDFAARDASPDDGSSPDVSIAPDSAELNDPPVALDDFSGALEGTPVTVDVLANDTDPDGDELMLVSIDSPLHGVASIVDGFVSYEPLDRFNGHDAINYTVSDPDGLTATATLHITTFSELDDPGGGDVPQVLVGSAPGLDASQLAIVINESDPYSVAVGEAYALAREVPDANVVRVSFDETGDVMSADDFAVLEADVSALVGPEIQGFALTWIAPYRVDCMSMTSAFALGYDQQYCGVGAGCQPSAPVDTFDSYSDAPFDDHAVRPTMMLALTNEADALEVIDRGVASDGTFPTGSGYLVRTSDSARSVRWPDLSSLPARWAFERGLELQYIDNNDGSGSNAIMDVDDVLFYFTGLTQVPALDTLAFVPGAAADHLTSFGGRLTATSGQMSIVRWLEAGATGSFGTVVEPCNYTTKFPRVSTLLDHYYRGESLLEAYWKSVNWPGEGVFIGEPLARPYGRVFLQRSGDTLVIGTSWLKPFTDYEVVGAPSPEGPFERVGEVIQRTNVGFEQIVVVPENHRFYMVQETNE